MRAPQVVACVGALALLTWGCSLHPATEDSEAAAAYQQVLKEQDRAAEQAMETSRFKEVGVIPPKDTAAFRSLSALCVDKEDHLLACDTKAGAVQVLDADGKALARWKTISRPEAIAAGSDGSVFVAGDGELARLDAEGKVVKSVKVDAKSVASMAVSGQDVYLAVRGGTGFDIRRYTHDLDEPKQIASGLRGCCGTLDIATRDEKLLVAENSRKRIVTFDRDGKELGHWGSDDRKDLAAFGGCCNPMNLCVAADGSVYTAESSPDRVKRYTADGAFKELVGWFPSGKSCRCVDLATAKDGRRIYVADADSRRIRIIECQDKDAQSAAKQPEPREHATSQQSRHEPEP